MGVYNEDMKCELFKLDYDFLEKSGTLVLEPPHPHTLLDACITLFQKIDTTVPRITVYRRPFYDNELDTVFTRNNAGEWKRTGAAGKRTHGDHER
jgi:hypothetical protein